MRGTSWQEAKLIRVFIKTEVEGKKPGKDFITNLFFWSHSTEPAVHFRKLHHFPVRFVQIPPNFETERVLLCGIGLFEIGKHVFSSFMYSDGTPLSFPRNRRVLVALLYIFCYGVKVCGIHNHLQF